MHLVAELPVGHPPAALLVLGVQEHREQVAPVLAARAPLGDDRRRGSRSSRRTARSTRRFNGRREPVRRSDQAARPAMKACISVSIAALASADSPPISASNRVLATISRVSRIMSAWTSRTWPSAHDCEHSLGGLDHEPGVGGDPLAVERRLGELALAPPELSLAGQEPLAQRPLRLPQPIVLDELAILVDQHLLDQVGMVGEHDRCLGPNRAETRSPYSRAQRVRCPAGRGRTPSSCRRASCRGGPGGRLRPRLRENGHELVDPP